MKKNELGFLAVVSIVIGSQIGSSAFVLPSVLAPFKTIGLLGWGVSVSGAIALALVFAELASHLPKNGGPHVYVGHAFGRTASFFTAWIYWIISWSSNSVLLVTAVNYLKTITGPLTMLECISIELMILFAVTYINVIGVKFSGIIETVLTGLKVVPLVVLPAIFFFFFEPSHFNFSLRDTIGNDDILSVISKTALLTFWGFIGVECATTPAESVKTPSKTIPRAIVIGTTCVALIYVLNTVSVIGVVGFDELMNTCAPYAIAMGKIFPQYSDVAIAIMAMIVCVGTLNAWTLTSSQIAYGAVSDGLFPKIFAKTNKAEAPVFSLWISSIGVIPFLVLSEINCMQHGLARLIDLLVSIFIFIYLVCCISFVKMIKKWYINKRKRLCMIALSQFAILFCIFTLYQDLLASFIVLGIFLVLGFPIFWKHRESIKRWSNQ